MRNNLELKFQIFYPPFPLFNQEVQRMDLSKMFPFIKMI